MTLRELWIRYQSKLLDRWDHTAAINMVTTQMMTVKGTRLEMQQFHPFRAKQSKNIKIGKGNMEPLAAAFLL